MDTRNRMMEQLLSDAGIGAGMRVLDVGCGGGDVTLMIALRVGEQGYVLGIDRDPRPLTAARERADKLGLSNVAFAEADLGALSHEHGSFDAVVGRRVLMYQPDPVAALQQLARALRQGGVVAFQEQDSATVADGRSRFPLHERVQGWIWETVRREGANVHMGMDLFTVLSAAGFSVEEVRAEAAIVTPGSDYPFGGIVRAMLPRIVQQGVATEEALCVDTLDQILAEERKKVGSVFVGDLVFSAWARKPG